MVCLAVMRRQSTHPPAQRWPSPMSVAPAPA
jgi:hypothetical protein